MTSVYYNENDPVAAAWLRELIRQDELPEGDVDERSMLDVAPDDVSGYTQCHWFAGIGGWPLALQLAGWPEDQAVWTGSPPCQPFSNAGHREGYNDDRHLAPQWLHLVSECRPSVVFGEQVASAATSQRHPWLDDLQDALEAQNYATAAVVLPACGVGAPHLRQRLWFVAERLGQPNGQHAGRNGRAGVSTQGGAAVRAERDARRASDSVGRLADSKHQRHRRSNRSFSEGLWNAVERRSSNFECESASTHHNDWRAADWLRCRDDKWRPVEPGTFPLADGVSARVGRLRGYGNAIVPQVAAEVIGAYMEAANE